MYDFQVAKLRTYFFRTESFIKGETLKQFLVNVGPNSLSVLSCSEEYKKKREKKSKKKKKKKKQQKIIKDMNRDYINECESTRN